MLPSEVVCEITDYLDLESLVCLGLASTFWNHAIPETVYRKTLHERNPFYHLDESCRSSWKECARVHMARVKGELSRTQANIFNHGDSDIPYELCRENPKMVEAITDTPLPCGFESLTDGYGLIQHETLLSRSSGNSLVVLKDVDMDGVELSLGSEAAQGSSVVDSRKLDKEGYVVEDTDTTVALSCTVFSSVANHPKIYYGELTYHNLPPTSFSLPYTMDQGRIKVKLFEASGKRYLTIRQRKFQTTDIYAINGSNVTYLTCWSPSQGPDEFSTQSVVWYDGCLIKWMFCGNPVTSRKLQFCTFDLKLQQDISFFYDCPREEIHDLYPHPQHSRYILVFSKQRKLSGVWDLHTQEYVQLDSPLAVSFPGLYNGQLRFWAYSESYLSKLAKKQTKADKNWIDVILFPNSRWLNLPRMFYDKTPNLARRVFGWGDVPVERCET